LYFLCISEPNGSGSTLNDKGGSTRWSKAL